MSQLKKFVKSPYFAATSGAALIALTLSPVFHSTSGVANGQSPVSSEPLSAPVVAPNPNPLGIAPPTTNSPLVPQAATEDLTALRERARTLQAELRRIPTNAAEQQAQQSVVAELSDLQAQIQRLESTAGQFSAYRLSREAQLGGGSAPFNPTAPAYNGLQMEAPSGLPADPRAALDVSGLNVANAAPQTLGGAPLDAGEASLLRQQKEALTQQYRQIQQTLRALQPGDEILANDLRNEQATLVNQLRQIDERLASAPAAIENPAIAQIPGAASQFSADLNATLPAANRLPVVPDAGTEIAARMQKVNQAAQLLREAGLVGLANHASNEAPRLATPNYTETQLVPGAWSEGSGLAEERSNPFQQISAEEVAAIRTSIDDLKTRVDALSETLSSVDTQLKLLTRQTVDAQLNAQPIANPAPQPIETPSVDEAPATDAEEEPLDSTL